jgi:hypothetical protein
MKRSTLSEKQVIVSIGIGGRPPFGQALGKYGAISERSQIPLSKKPLPPRLPLFNRLAKAREGRLLGHLRASSRLPHQPTPNHSESEAFQ